MQEIVGVKDYVQSRVALASYSCQNARSRETIEMAVKGPQAWGIAVVKARRVCLPGRYLH